jgi:hypothetical protein
VIIAIVRTALNILVSLAVLGGFGALVLIGVVRTLRASEVAPSFNEPYLYVATGLAGLVGAVVAVGFGLKQPAPSPQNPSPIMAENAAGLGKILASAGAPTFAQILLGSLYAVAYIVLGIVAIVVWIIKADLTPDLVKNMASVSVGMLLPIARTFLLEPSR